ncbi:MAG: hypothetical protein ACI90V_010181, partial [Bacillariaceae sp.]
MCHGGQTEVLYGFRLLFFQSIIVQCIISNRISIWGELN